MLLKTTMAFYRRMRTSLTTVLVLLILGFVFLACYNTMHSVHVPTCRQEEPSVDWIGETRETIAPDQQTETTPSNDVIISSYMRSGSTFLSRLMAFRKDSFLFYEPFWKTNQWEYYRGAKSVCSSRHTKCVSKTAPETVAETLANIFQCKFEGFENIISDNTNTRLADSSWDEYRKCRHERVPMEKCVPNLVGPCQNAKHRVTKVIRLTVDMFESTLERFKNVKLIHMFRDPRAVLNSRLTTDWYKLKPKYIEQNAKSLCNKMLYDLKYGTRLMKKYPGRVMFLLFEDLIDNIQIKRRILYDLHGMSHKQDDLLFDNVTEEIHKDQHVGKSAEIDHTTRFASWWRSSLPWGTVRVVDRVCKTVYNRLGYLPMANETQLQDSSFSVIRKPYTYALDVNDIALFD